MSAVEEHFRVQAAHCAEMGSSFTGKVVQFVLDCLGQDLPIVRVIRDWPRDPRPDALSLRVAGGLHGLVLRGQAPDLAAAYPGGGRFGDDGYLAQTVADALAEHGAVLEEILASPPQTNEVGRSGVLAGGFLTVAAATGKPLALLEIGASGGLNLMWDQYRYILGGAQWGAATAEPCLAPDWKGPPPPCPPVRVVARAGCDHRPMDLHDRAGQMRLRSYIWADQNARLARLDAAMAVLAASDLFIDKADAVEWLGNRLKDRPRGVATVLFHSIFWQYLPEETKLALQTMIGQAGATADKDSPFAWLRMEADPEMRRAEVKLTLWPDGGERLLAHANFHGHWVRWLADGPEAAV